MKMPCGLKNLSRFSFPHKYGVLDRIYGKSLSSNGMAFVETVFGPTWKLDLRNLQHRWCVYGSIFGPTSSKWIRKNLSKGGVIIDSGANIGQSLVEFAQYPDVTIYAFEPIPSALEWIAESLEHNNCTNITVIPSGLYKDSREIEIQVAGSSEIHGAHATLRDDWYVDKSYERIKIEVITLDEFAEKRDISSIQFWKLDVEGAELEALVGAEALLKNHQIKSLLVETDAVKSGVFDYMADFAYSPYLLNKHSEPVPFAQSGELASDYIFLPDS